MGAVNIIILYFEDLATVHLMFSDNF